jgi:hypothetical protein
MIEIVGFGYPAEGEAVGSNQSVSPAPFLIVSLRFQQKTFRDFQMRDNQRPIAAFGRRIIPSLYDFAKYRFCVR